MKKRLFGLLLAVCLVASLSLPASAESFTGGEGWRVVFTADNKMESTFRSSALTEAVSGLQPGDDITFHLTMENRNAVPTDWYMNNKVLYSLEDRSANAATSGGAYSYELVYTDAAGAERVLFSSDTVGGEGKSEAGEGLHRTTDALKDFFYLETLTSGQTSGITLRVALEGETQGNDYQDTLADLAMSFAVELNPDDDGPGAPTSPSVIVRTGDETDLNKYYAIMAGSGLLFLVLALDSIRRRRKAKKEGKE